MNTAWTMGEGMASYTHWQQAKAMGQRKPWGTGWGLHTVAATQWA